MFPVIFKTTLKRRTIPSNCGIKEALKDSKRIPYLMVLNFILSRTDIWDLVPNKIKQLDSPRVLNSKSGNGFCKAVPAGYVKDHTSSRFSINKNFRRPE